jgi:hypothetical protein
MRKAAAGFLAAIALSGCGVQEKNEPRYQLTRDGVYVQGKTLVQLPDWLWAGEAYACPPDLALGPQGEAVVTSNVVPILWRVDPVTLAVSVHPIELDTLRDRDVGFFSLAWSAEQAAYIAVSDLQGTVWKIDRSLTRGEKISSDPKYGRTACAIN